MSRKIPPKQCPRCGETGQWFTGEICHNCYRNYKWKRKLITCKRCGRQKPNHAKGMCGGCYQTKFQLDKVKAWNHQKRHKISPQLYKQITKACIVCGFNKFVELHHIDCNRHNSDEKNLIGLCPNHHKMLHTIEHGQFLKEVIERLITLKRYQTTLTFQHKEEVSAKI